MQIKNFIIIIEAEDENVYQLFLTPKKTKIINNIINKNPLVIDKKLETIQFPYEK